MSRIFALLAGWLGDLLLGDPAWLPHPVVGFGKLIAAGEKRWNKGENRRRKGAFLALGLVLGVFLLTLAILMGLHAAGEALHLGPWLQRIAEAVCIFFCLAGTTLVREVREVFRSGPPPSKPWPKTSTTASSRRFSGCSCWAYRA